MDRKSQSPLKQGISVKEQNRRSPSSMAEFNQISYSSIPKATKPFTLNHIPAQKPKVVVGTKGIGSQQKVAIQRQKEEKKMNYYTYNKLVGEADGGKELSKEQFQEILQKYHESWQNRVYVHFARTDVFKECVRVKPPCLCFCGHHFKTHEWWDSQTKQIKCRAPGCQCGKYRYLHHQGSWFLMCKCKHTAIDHNPNGAPGPCSKAGCACSGFQTSFSCQCGGSWQNHDTIVDTEEERRQQGKPVDTDVVKTRLKDKQVEGCGKCMGCKNRMPCYNRKK
ncbi:hypothetical protein ABPG72_020227 [Tetrahymena utriculariae]